MRAAVVATTPLVMLPGYAHTMHTRVMHISPFGEGSSRKVRESIVRFSRRWATATTPERVLRRVAGTNRWSHGGGLFADEITGAQFTLQSLWPLVREPELWTVGRSPGEEEEEQDEGDGDGEYFWVVPRVKTDADAEIRIATLERAERRTEARKRIRPREAGEARERVRLMVEYGERWPLWGEGPLAPWELGLSTGLTERLAAWQLLWETGFDYKTGWKSDADEQQFEHDERLLHAALADEVRAFGDVEPLGD